MYFNDLQWQLIEGNVPHEPNILGPFVHLCGGLQTDDVTNLRTMFLHHRQFLALDCSAQFLYRLSKVSGNVYIKLLNAYEVNDVDPC